MGLGYHWSIAVHIADCRSTLKVKAFARSLAPKPALSMFPSDKGPPVKITKAVITAAGANQRSLPHQMLVDRDGVEKSVLSIIASEAVRTGVDEICVVIHPGDEARYRQSMNIDQERLTLIPQTEARGYGHAIYCARDFVADEPFLHMVGDHVYVAPDGRSSAAELVELAVASECAVSGVQATRENELAYFGAVSGQRIKGARHVYQIDRVVEKPTPTEAEQTLLVPGLRSGHYLCFFGIHVLTPTLFTILEPRIAAGDHRIDLSSALHELAQREKYLAIEASGKRYPVDVKYGLLNAQLALALSGGDKSEVLSLICEVLAQSHSN